VKCACAGRKASAASSARGESCTSTARPCRRRRFLFGGGTASRFVPLSFTPAEQGRVLNSSRPIDPRDDETVKEENNSVSQHLKVVDSKIHVLLADQSAALGSFRYLAGHADA